MADPVAYNGYRVGDRVELHPATDFWMSGDRYGEIVRLVLQSHRIHVKMDRSGRVLKLRSSNLLRKLEGVTS